MKTVALLIGIIGMFIAGSTHAAEPSECSIIAWAEEVRDDFRTDCQVRFIKDVAALKATGDDFVEFGEDVADFFTEEIPAFFMGLYYGLDVATAPLRW